MRNPSPIQKTGDALWKMLIGYYTEDQVEGGWEVIEALLRRHYEGGDYVKS